MIGEIVIGLIGFALIKKSKQTQGVGAVKRRIYKEINDAQKQGIDLYSPYDPDDRDKLSRLASKYNYKHRSTSGKSREEQYFNGLRRQFNAISGIGAMQRPYQEYPIYNDKGDTILIYKDYGTRDEQLDMAYNLIDDMFGNNDRDAYWKAVAYIARGGKVVWKSKDKGGTVIALGAETLFNRNSDAERRARINYLASKEKGGLYLDGIAHSLWEDANGYSNNIDSQLYRDAIEEVILSYTSRKQAQDAILAMYDEMFKEPDVPENDNPNNEVPF